MKKEESRQGDSLVFEGMTSISAVLKGGFRKIKEVFIDEEKIRKKAREIDYLRKMQSVYGYVITLTDENTLSQMTTGNTHGGIVAVCSQRVIPPIDEIELKPDGFYVMIDGIEDPYNFGYALRSLYAAGVDAVILSPRNWMNAAGVVCRSSAGASELLPLYVSDGTAACDFFKKNNIKTVAAGIRNSISAYDADLTFPVFLIVGGEKRGISASVLSLADITVRLDYGRSFCGSLSAASAASILAYEIFRQNRKN